MSQLPPSKWSNKLMWPAFGLLALGILVSLFRDEWTPFISGFLVFIILAVTEAVLRERQAAFHRNGPKKDSWDRRGDSRYYKENP